MEIGSYIILTDQQLVSLISDGDSSAFEVLFNRYKDAIYKFYVQRCGGGSNEDIEDLMQETFVKVFLNIDKYNPAFTFGQWIYTIARNTLIDWSRKRHDELSIDSLRGVGDVMQSASTEVLPDERIINSQRRTELERHLATMDERYRRLIELRFFKEYSYEEIAEALSLPLGTVKTQIHRAREKICKLITTEI